jgi:hypothetical protein
MKKKYYYERIQRTYFKPKQAEVFNEAESWCWWAGIGFSPDSGLV